MEKGTKAMVSSSRVPRMLNFWYETRGDAYEKVI
jgi:hypothetical protein